MSTLDIGVVPPTTRPRPLVSALDDRRGTAGMWLFIVTEGFLFVMFFVAYFYLAKGGFTWPTEQPPKLTYALILLAILLSSSAVLHWGEKRVKEGQHRKGRNAALATFLIGIAFMILQVFEYRDHLKELTPASNAYGSIFYTITTFHAAHVVLGLCMLLFIMFLPHYEPVERTPHRPYHNAALYWHFVDFVWIWIVLFLYVTPNLR